MVVVETRVDRRFEFGLVTGQQSRHGVGRGREIAVAQQFGEPRDGAERNVHTLAAPRVQRMAGVTQQYAVPVRPALGVDHRDGVHPGDARLDTRERRDQLRQPATQLRRTGLGPVVDRVAKQREADLPFAPDARNHADDTARRQEDVDVVARILERARRKQRQQRVLVIVDAGVDPQRAPVAG